MPKLKSINENLLAYCRRRLPSISVWTNHPQIKANQSLKALQTCWLAEINRSHEWLGSSRWSLHPHPPTGSASALRGSIFASVIPTRPWRDGIPGSAVPVSQGNAPWRRPGKAPIGKTGLRWWTWVPFSSGIQGVSTSQPADMSRNSLFLINSRLCCFLTFVTAWMLRF